jgi:hypothetical protein
MTQTLHGIINGKIIELTVDPGVPPGQQVEVVIMPVSAQQQVWGEGLRRCAGALASEWTEEDDQILQEIYEQRKFDTRPEIPE